MNFKQGSIVLTIMSYHNYATHQLNVIIELIKIMLHISLTIFMFYLLFL